MNSENAKVESPSRLVLRIKEVAHGGGAFLGVRRNQELALKRDDRGRFDHPYFFAACSGSP